MRRPGILVALDLPSLDEAVAMGERLSSDVDGFKVGFRLLHGPDPHPVERIAELGLPVFVDAKVHDIPVVVETAMANLGRRGARWVTAHASGGDEMLRAAVAGLTVGSDGSAGVLGVTVLTSLDARDLRRIGIEASVTTQVSRLAALTAAAGAEGVICAVGEVSAVKGAGERLLAVTPGISGAAEPAPDQKRTATVSEAVRAGSDYLVIGRAITGSADPKAAVTAIAAELIRA